MNKFALVLIFLVFQLCINAQSQTEIYSLEDPSYALPNGIIQVRNRSVPVYESNSENWKLRGNFIYSFIELSSGIHFEVYDINHFEIVVKLTVPNHGLEITAFAIDYNQDIGFYSLHSDDYSYLYTFSPKNYKGASIYDSIPLLLVKEIEIGKNKVCYQLYDNSVVLKNFKGNLFNKEILAEQWILVNDKLIFFYNKKLTLLDLNNFNENNIEKKHNHVLLFQSSANSDGFFYTIWENDSSVINYYKFQSNRIFEDIVHDVGFVDRIFLNPDEMMFIYSHKSRQYDSSGFQVIEPYYIEFDYAINLEKTRLNCIPIYRRIY